MRAIIYPAYFRSVESGGYSIDFTDLPGCASAAATLEEAVSASREALSLHLFGMMEDAAPLPAASDPFALPAEAGAFIAIVEGHPEIVCFDAPADRR